MRLFKEQEVPPEDAPHVFRESRFGKVFLFLWLFAALLGGVFLVIHSFEDAWPLRLVGGVLALLMLPLSLITFGVVKASFRRSNWVFRVGENGVWIKFRSYLNWHFPEDDLVVGFFSWPEIVWIRKTREKRTVPYRDTTRDERSVFLDMKVRGETTALEKLIQREREHPAAGKGVKSKSNHYPVRMESPGLIRVDWQSLNSALTPNLKAALRLLENRVQVEPELVVTTDPKNREEMEKMILTFAERGETLQAMTLAHQVYGYSLTEAKKFVEGLGSSSPEMGSKTGPSFD